MTINIKSYPLPRPSPYTVQSAGVALASGEFQLQSGISIKNNKLPKDIEDYFSRLSQIIHDHPETDHQLYQQS